MSDVRTHDVISEVAKPAPRIERKFFIRPRNISFAYNLLRQVCRLDNEYPEEQVNSLYFDTPDLDQHTKSVSGDFRKDKVRIRWYSGIDNHQEQEPAPVFLELKSRQGFASNLHRSGLDVEHIMRLGGWESLDMVLRYTRSVKFEESLRLYQEIKG